MAGNTLTPKPHHRTTHGESGRNGTPEYFAWENMRRRCLWPNHPDFKNYGGRGIKVCEQWQTSYKNFLNDMGRRPSSQHSLDRKNVNLGYSKMNCRWATAVEQVNNRRKIGLIEQFTTVELLEELAKRRKVERPITREVSRRQRKTG